MLDSHRISLVVQTVNCLPTMWETQVRSLDQEDPLENEMATHSSTLAWKIPWTEERGRLQPMGSQRVRHDWVASLCFIETSSHSITSHHYAICYLFQSLLHEAKRITPTSEMGKLKD